MKETGVISKLISRAVAAVVVLALGFVAGYVVKGITTTHEHEHVVGDSNQPQAEKKPTWWICSMHPQIRQQKSGKCSICLMDLIPELTEDSDLGPRQISFSEEAIKLMELDTTPVERKFVTSEIRMVGKIDYDETRVKHITAWVPGRLDRLYVARGSGGAACGDCRSGEHKAGRFRFYRQNEIFQRRSRQSQVETARP
jgi:Cu(I)/Ag(I) efflux system membrane fusion protein